MVYTDTCWLCERAWIFHDDDVAPFLCDECHGLYAQVKIVNEILEGTYVPLNGEEDG